MNPKIQLLKSLIGDDAANSVLRVAADIDETAQKEGRKFKENKNMDDFLQFLEAYKMYTAQKQVAEAQAPAPEPEAEQPATQQIDTAAIVDAVAKAVKEAVREAVTEATAAKQADTATTVLAELQTAVKELQTANTKLQAEIAALKIPVTSGAGFRATEVNPQAAMQAVKQNGSNPVAQSLDATFNWLAGGDK
jgi:hypothetical protein